MKLPFFILIAYFLFSCLLLTTYATEKNESTKIIHNVSAYVRFCHLFTTSKPAVSLHKDMHPTEKNESTKIIHNVSAYVRFRHLINTSKPAVSLHKNTHPTALKLLHSIKKDIRYLIFKTFLTIQDLLVLRQTCKDFQILVLPNDTQMVMFCEDFCSKEKIEVPLIWFDLKYFLNQSYHNAFNPGMKMFNIKEYQYAVLTHNHNNNQQIISWYNEHTPYPKILFHEELNKLIKNYIKNKKKVFADKNCLKIWEDFLTPPKTTSIGMWSKITKQGNVVTGEKIDENSLYIHLHDSDIIQPVHSQLKNVKMLFNTDHAFAALLVNKRAVAWGSKYSGGKISDKIQAQLQNVKFIFSTGAAFAALLADESVIAWGNEEFGGTIVDEIQKQLKNVKTIFSNWRAFAALLKNGSVVCWGNESHGGNISNTIQNQLKNVTMIASTMNAFAALLDDGSVIAWGSEEFGGKIPHEKQIQLKNVKMIISNEGAFSALLKDGSVIVWGNWYYGYVPDLVLPKLNDVKMIVSTLYNFAALLKDGSVVNWGSPIFRENQPIEIHHVNMIFSNDGAFATLLDNGSVFAWGLQHYGGIIPDEIQFKFFLGKIVKTIFPNKKGFTALCNDGEMIKWGQN